jgi:anti-sigma regulatory factor (Ser/Thr protein kinase)
MRLRVFPTVEAPRQVRREVASLATDLDERSLSDVKTVISELVTMSVAHGASRPIEVCLDLDDGRLEGALCDDGPGARALVRARNRQDDSLVLRIVDGLVEDWGASDRDRRIWFRMKVVRPA